MIRVLICDDAAAFSLLAGHWLANCADLDVVATLHTGPELLDALTTVTPDVIVLDHLLGAMDSEELVPLIRSRQPDVGIVLVSGMPSDLLAGIASRSGADAFTSKATRPDALCDLIREVAGRAARADPQPPGGPA